MRKIVALFLTITLCANLILCRIAFADEVNLDEIRDNMVAAGLDESLVYSMPKEQVLKYKQIALASCRTYYFKVSEDANSGESMIEEVTEAECLEAIAQDNLIETCASIDESYMELTICLTPSEEENGRYNVLTCYEWLREPVCRFNDYLAVTIHSGLVIIPDTEYAFQQYDSVDSLNFYTTHSINGSVVESGVGGHCMSIALPPITSGDTRYYDFRGYLSYDIRVAEVGEDGQLHAAVYAAYAHHILVPSFTVGITLPKNWYASVTPTSSFDYMYEQMNFLYEE